MKDLDLECLPGWRFCRIPRGQKGPRYANWVNQPFTLDQIEADSNIGVILGPVSQNLIAVDFDGPTAWAWWDRNIGIPIPQTVAWSSGRDGRCQMAFIAPEEIVPLLSTRQITHTKDPEIAEGEGFEFRWQGGQSVVPPSIHPTTGEPYFWVNSPRDTDIAEAPVELLEAWLRDERPRTPWQELGSGPPPGDISTVDDATLNTLIWHLNIIKQHRPRPERDFWARVSWAVKHTIGETAAINLMKDTWPEEEQGEYHRLLRGQAPGQPVTLGSIIFWARELDPTIRPTKIPERNYLNDSTIPTRGS